MLTDGYIYYLVVLLSIPPALANSKPATGWNIYLFCLTVFVGLRHEVGSDWPAYLLQAERLQGISVLEILSYPEPLFYLLVWISANTGMSIYGANVATTLIFLVGIFAFCRRLPNPWLGLSTALPFLVIVVGMSANRQAAAIGVIFYLLANQDRFGLFRQGFLLVCAALFHKSALVMVFVLALMPNISRGSRVSILAISLIGVWLAIEQSDVVGRYESSYLSAEGRDQFVAGGALLQILINAVPAIILLTFWRRLSKWIPSRTTMGWLATFAVILLPLSTTFSVAASRISFYLFPIAICTFAAIPQVVSASTTSHLPRLMILGTNFAVLAIWLNLANHAYNHLPYGNLLFG